MPKSPDCLLREKLEESRPIAVWGIGKEGCSTIAKFLSWGWLPEKDFFVFADTDSNKNSCIAGFDIHKERSLLDAPQEYRLILKSPGIPVLEFPRLLSCVVKNQISIILEIFSSKSIGVTGTKGKSTCAKLLYDLLSHADYDVALLGNIGVPAFDAIDERWRDWYVLECSSFQLDQVRHSPQYSVVLDIYPEHLDYHMGWARYLEAKSRIFLYPQGEGSRCYMTSRTYEIYESISLPKSVFARPNYVRHSNQYFKAIDGFDLSRSLAYSHYRPMLSAVLAICFDLGVKNEFIEVVFSSFQGLKHRLQPFKSRSGRRFINDSISTIPEATIAALRSEPQAGCLVVGGKSRGLDQSDLIECLCGWEGIVVTMDQTGVEIERGIKALNPKQTVFRAINFSEIADIFVRHCSDEQSCVFSPGAPTSGIYASFAERGEAFMDAVRSL